MSLYLRNYPILNELEAKKMVVVCREHDLSPSTVSGWKRDYEANPKEAFKGHGRIWKEDEDTRNDAMEIASLRSVSLIEGFEFELEKRSRFLV